MKRVFIILLFIPTSLYCQQSINYREFNAGLYLGDDITIFPGASYLWGKTIYYENNTLLDYQGGFALPTMITGKIGIGVGNDSHSAIIGVRPFPSSFYLQFTFKETRLISFEAMPPPAWGDWSPTATWPVILNYGYRF